MDSAVQKILKSLHKELFAALDSGEQRLPAWVRSLSYDTGLEVGEMLAAISTALGRTQAHRGDLWLHEQLHRAAALGNGNVRAGIAKLLVDEPAIGILLSKAVDAQGRLIKPVPEVASDFAVNEILETKPSPLTAGDVLSLVGLLVDRDQLDEAAVVLKLAMRSIPHEGFVNDRRWKPLVMRLGQHVL